MSEPALVFNPADKIGNVSSVDTARVLVAVSNGTLLTSIGVGHLIAVSGTRDGEYLIAITERVTRILGQDFADAEDNTQEVALAIVPTDLLRAALVGTFRTIEGDVVNRFKRGADSFPQIDRECFVITGGNLQRFMGILGSAIPKEEQLKLGHFLADRSAEAIANGDKFFQRHAAILGSTGSGKSWAVALILERASKLKHPNIIVFDMHGEYKPLADKTKGGFAKRFKIAGPGDLVKPGDDVLFLPYWLLNRDEMLSMIVDRSDFNAPNQASRFTLHARQLKGATLTKEKKDSIKDTFTVNSPVPYDMNDLVNLLTQDNETKGVGKNGAPVKGDWEGQLTRFLSRLEAKLEDRRYGFMFLPPKATLAYEWLAKQMLKMLDSTSGEGIKIVDFSEVPADVLPVVTGTFARLLYDVQFWMPWDKRTPVTLLCDEAHLYLPVREDADATQKQALGAFERIAKEGRKYGFSLLVVSQRPSDVSKTILSQCNNFLSLRLTNETDQNVIHKLMPESLAGLTSILPLLDTGEALLLGDAVLLPTRIKLDKPAVEPDSSTLDFWLDWNTVSSDSAAIYSAVECMRSQTRSAK